MEDVVLYESRDGIAQITINRPHRKNAIDEQVEVALADCWRRFNDSDEDRVAILTGMGEDAFSSGRDRDAKGVPEYRKFTPGVDIPVEKPVIAAVSGWCVGGALTLVQMCDLCVAAENAKFVYPEVKVGFAGGLIGSLSVRIPHKIAMELMLLGEPVSAERAYQVGFVNRLVPVGEHLNEARAIAEKMVHHAPLVLRMLKRFANSTLPKGPIELASQALRETDALFASRDYQEGLESFAKRREPSFKGD